MKQAPLLALAMTLTVALPAAAKTVSAPIAAAVAASDRPEADKARDAERKPAEMLAYAGVYPGEKIAEILPGGGYFTRLFSAAVGDKGHVYAIGFGDGAPIKAMIAQPGHANISWIAFTPDFTVDAPVDLVWTSQNYHDAYNRDPAAAASLDAAAFKALKPGGIYIVLDHAGLPDGDNKTLHRIDPALVKDQVIRAGFEFVGADDTLRNPADPHNANVRDPSIRGHTDQFIFKFRKPK